MDKSKPLLYSLGEDWDEASEMSKTEMSYLFAVSRTLSFGILILLGEYIYCSS